MCKFKEVVSFVIVAVGSVKYWKVIEATILIMRRC